MARTSLNVGMIGYNFMGKAHSNAWRQAPKFFDLPADIVLHTICGRSARNVESAREQLGWKKSSTDWKGVVSDPEIDLVEFAPQMTVTARSLWRPPDTASLFSVKSRWRWMSTNVKRWSRPSKRRRS
jgi:hypothetical protein